MAGAAPSDGLAGIQPAEWPERLAIERVPTRSLSRIDLPSTRARRGPALSALGRRSGPLRPGHRRSSAARSGDRGRTGDDDGHTGWRPFRAVRRRRTGRGLAARHLSLRDGRLAEDAPARSAMAPRTIEAAPSRTAPASGGRAPCRCRGSDRLSPRSAGVRGRPRGSAPTVARDPPGQERRLGDGAADLARRAAGGVLGDVPSADAGDPDLGAPKSNATWWLEMARERSTVSPRLRSRSARRGRVRRAPRASPEIVPHVAPEVRHRRESRTPDAPSSTSARTRTRSATGTGRPEARGGAGGDARL